ncbi:MAG TPA: peptidase M16 [Nitrospiraceae bacterium]|jgi:zinc protease|nr:peptidase M16 [Nitrospiraceae bacterium]
MRHRIVIVLLLTLSLHFASASALHAATDVGVVRAMLKNGLKVIIVQNSLAPVVNTQLNYLVGANEDPPGFPGTAHAQEHMLFRGSTGLSANQLSAIIAALGGEFNADTQQSVTQYFSTVPADNLNIALRIEAIRMRGVLDSRRLWKLERGAIEQEVAQDLSNSEYRFYTKLLSELFHDTPYGHDALGTQASFDKMTGKMLKKFHHDWYGPNNAILVIAGNIDPEKTLKMAREVFEWIPERPTPPRPAVHLKPLKAATINLETDLHYGLAVLAYRLPGYESPDYAAGQILGDVLESKRGNLYALVPQGKALSIDVGTNAFSRAAFGYVAAAFPKGNDGALLISTMKDIIEDYLKNGFPVELVEAVKRLEIANEEFQKNSVEGLASLWSQALAVEGRNSPDEDIEAIRKVTVADVNRVARTYLVNNTAITAVLQPRPSGEPVPSTNIRGKETFASRRTRRLSLPAWASKLASLPASPLSTVNPVVTVLPNGLRLIVQPENVSGTISIYGKIKNNPSLQIPKGQEGVNEVLNSLFSYGTTTMDRLAFQKALDDSAARESAGTSFSLQVLTEHFDRGVELLSDNLLHPALSEDAFKVVQQETGGALSGLLQSPSYLSNRALITALYPKNDPALRQATPDTVAMLALTDVTNYYRKIFRPDMTTVVVIGQVTPHQAEAVIKKYFGNWEATGPKPETELPPVPPNKPSSAAVPDRSRVQTSVTLAETVGITRSYTDYYPLQVGLHVLSGAFYATRLYQDLRERTGLVYSVEALLDAGESRSIFEVLYACDQKNVAKARAIIERNLREMQTKLVTPEELLQAKTLLLRQTPLSESSVEDIAEKLLYLSLEDLPLDEPVRAMKRYREITASQVRAAFTKWVRPRDVVQISLGLNPK